MPQPIVTLSHRHTADEPTTRGEIRSEDKVRGSLIQHSNRVHPVSSQIPQANLEVDTSTMLYWDQTQHSDEFVAAVTQRLFDDEDRRLRAERVALQTQQFRCIACLEDCPEDDLAPIHGCVHTFCRTCLRDHVVSELTQKILPTFCPQCKGTDVHNNPGCESSYQCSLYHEYN
jgi:hypothetical protein